MNATHVKWEKADPQIDTISQAAIVFHFDGQILAPRTEQRRSEFYALGAKCAHGAVR